MRCSTGCFQNPDPPASASECGELGWHGCCHAGGLLPSVMWSLSEAWKDSPVTRNLLKPVGMELEAGRMQLLGLRVLFSFFTGCLMECVCVCVCFACVCNTHTWRPHVQGYPLSVLPPLCRALGAVVTLLLWGQLFAVDLGNDAMDTTGESLGFSGHRAPQHGCAPVWPYQSFTM